MSYYKTCPHCGATLDPGEKCDCQDGLTLSQAIELQKIWNALDENGREYLMRLARSMKEGEQAG